MLGTATSRRTRLSTALLTVILLASCASNGGDSAADGPPTAPAGDPDPDGGDDSDGGVVGERPPPVHDWDDLEREVSLTGGWRLRDCQGDAPLRCLHSLDGSVRGVIGLLRFEEHEGLLGAYDVDRASAALQEMVTDFETWLIDDRDAACPQHTVKLELPELVGIGGVPAVIRGHRVVTPDGDPVERSLVAYIADGGDLVLVTVIATAPDGCTHVEELDELAPNELDQLHAELRALMLHGSIPQG